MKKIKFASLSLLTVLAVAWVACDNSTPKKVTTPTETAAPAVETLDSTLVEATATRQITDGDLEPLTKTQKKLLRNYIFARHGYKFVDRDMKDYFSRFDWYKPEHTQAEARAEFNEVEKYNFQFILSKE